MTDEDTCFICGESRPNSIEQHHIVPRRFGGSDDSENLVGLCASCHSAVEKLYDRRFYDKLGVKKAATSSTCALDGCTATADKTLDNHGDNFPVCSAHADKCGASLGVYSGHCSQTRTTVVRSYYDNKIQMRCDDHSVCDKSGCESRNVFFDPKSTIPYQRCLKHFESGDEQESLRRSGGGST